MAVRRKGFVISLDAMLALLLLLVIIISATSYFAKVNFEAGSNAVLKEVAMDSITVLEKSGILEEAISTGSANNVRAFLNRLPNNICAELRAHSESDLDTPVFTVLGQECKRDFREQAIAKRSVVIANSGNAGMYIAELRAWYRVSG